MPELTEDEITTRAIEQALRELPAPTREQAHDAVCSMIAVIASSYWNRLNPEIGIHPDDRDELIRIRRLEHATRLLRQDEAEIARLREIERYARAHIREIEHGLDYDVFDHLGEAEAALRVACFPETAGKQRETPTNERTAS